MTNTEQKSPVFTCDNGINRQWLMECVNEGWIKFDTEKDKNIFIHLVRDMAPPVDDVLDKIRDENNKRKKEAESEG